MSEQTPEQEETPTRVTDKRGLKKQPTKPEQPLPTAEELLADTPVVTDESEFVRQQREAEEDARRAAEWESLSDDEKQAVLAQQAAEAESSPYAGGGIQTDGETKKELLSVFVIEIDLDGTATAKPIHMYDPDKVEVQREVDPRMMYRSCAEIMLDIDAAETAHLTIQMMQHVGAQAAAAQRAQALEASLQQRGMTSRRGRR